MSTPQFTPAWTPGPWLTTDSGTVYALEDYRGRFKIEQRNRFSVQINAGPETPQYEVKANAQLISAAPALYEALEELRSIVQGLLDGDQYVFDSFTLQPAEIALARARGELP